MSQDPLDRMERGFEYSVGRRVAYRLPLGFGVALVILLSLLRHCS